MLKPFLLILSGIALAFFLRWLFEQFYSFNAQKPEDYRTGTPVFDITEQLNGPMDAYGLVYDYRGRVNARFTARMNGVWSDGKGVLSEDFNYDSGRTQKREWTIEMGEDGHFTTTAPDIIGTGIGRQLGNAVRLEYRIVLPEDAGGYTLDVVDWMYLFEGGTILNKSEFRMFGIKVGSLIATFKKLD